MSYGTCKKCGCTDNHACRSDIHGYCWWIDQTQELCSYCLDSFASDITIVRPGKKELNQIKTNYD